MEAAYLKVTLRLHEACNRQIPSAARSKPLMLKYRGNSTLK